MLRASTYLVKEDKSLSDKLLLLENEYKKSKISNENSNSKNYFSLTKNLNFEPKCVNRNSCRVCLEDPNCVWCNTENMCTVGDKSGPFDGSCFKTFKYSYCEDSCFNYNSCSKCVENPVCGWCNQINKCIEGNSKKSIGILCENGYVHRDNQGRCSNHFLNNKFGLN